MQLQNIIYFSLLLLLVDFTISTKISDSCEIDESTRHSCKSKGSEWSVCRECESLTSESCDLKSSDECRCQHIEIDGEGGSTCNSVDSQGRWCYVAESSACDDLVEASVSIPRGFYMDEDLYISHKACNNFDEDAFEDSLTELGNEPFLVDVEFDAEVNLAEEFGGEIKMETPEQCQALCLENKDICFGWTFDDFDEGTGKGTCTMKGDQVCCNQVNKKICKPGAISGFACQNSIDQLNCWSTVGRCPCSKTAPIDGSPTFCSGCSLAENHDPTVGNVLLKRCEYNRKVFQFIRGRWRAVRRSVSPTCDEN